MPLGLADITEANVGYLAKKDVAQLLECARVIYAGIGRADFQIHVITALKCAFSSTVAIWSRMETRDGEPPAITIYSYPIDYLPPTFGTDLSALAHYHPAFIVTALSRGLPLPLEIRRPFQEKFVREILAQRAVRITDAENKARFRATPLYRKLFKPLGLDFQMGFFSMREDAWMGAVIFCRRRRDFTERERRMLDLLVPHIRRAFAHDKVMGGGRTGGGSEPMASSAADIYQCNALTVNRYGGVSFCTDGAKRILKKYYGGAGLSGGRLPKMVLEQFITRTPGDIPLTSPGPLFFRSPLGRLSALVGVRGPDGAFPLYLHESPPPDRGNELLTGRESDVLYWVAAGKTNKEIAQILAISPHTVRTHLENIFKKLGVENRTAAASFSKYLPSGV